MKIALAQMKMDTDIEKNFQKSLQLICEAAEKKADLICFPETAGCEGYKQFGFNWKKQLARIIGFPVVSLIVATIITWLS